GAIGNINRVVNELIGFSRIRVVGIWERLRVAVSRAISAKHKTGGLLKLRLEEKCIRRGNGPVVKTLCIGFARRDRSHPVIKSGRITVTTEKVQILLTD